MEFMLPVINFWILFLYYRFGDRAFLEVVRFPQLCPVYLRLYHLYGSIDLSVYE